MNAPAAELPIQANGDISAVVFSGDGTLPATAGRGATIKLRDATVKLKKGAIPGCMSAFVTAQR